MHQLRSVLRPLFLFFLSGWVGMGAQPAEAQQTVTLSGRVTEAAGQAVPRVSVSLLRMPGWLWTDGQDTDGNGSYRLSVLPGTYLLRIESPHGPLIPYETELTLSTNTTRNIVLETGVTLSGQVTSSAGQPVPWAWLWVADVENDVDVSFGGADESGRYSLGVPPGTYQVNVASDDFLNPKLEGVAVPQDTVLNITLNSGVLLEGRVVDDAGQPVPGARVCAHEPTEIEWWRFCFQTDPAGSFRLRVPPAEYVVTVRPVLPLQPTRLRRIEVSGEGVTDLVLTVSRQPIPFVPDDPPKAVLISISDPTPDGEVTLRGAAGTVAPGSTVFMATLNTGHFTTAQATTSGSFTATLFAPAGTSILIKADPFGTTVAEFLDAFLADSEASPNALAVFPSTILRVADRPGAGIPVSGAGRVEWGNLPTWTFHGSLTTQLLAPGDPLRIHGTVRVASPALQEVGTLQVNPSLKLRPLSDLDGSSLLQAQSSASTLLTPTGLPIEREPMWWVTDLSLTTKNSPWSKRLPLRLKRR